jgi:hypothetical protein
MISLVPIIAITPEHCSRMCRILRRGIPVHIEVTVRNKFGRYPSRG